MRPQIKAAIKNIRSDRERGARQLALAALEALGAVADDDADGFKESAQALAFARPMMAAVQNAVALAWYNCANGSTPAEAVRDAIDGIEQAPEGMTLAARQVIPTDTVMTYSYSSTVIELLARLKPRRAIVSEGRPLGEGLAQARELRAAGISITFITEAQMALFVQEADAVVVGADTILPDGGFINKIGTRLLALAAKDAGVPFYPVTETLKVAAPSEPIPFAPEEGRKREVTSARWLEVRNIIYEATPRRLVTAYVTEEGLLKPTRIQSYVRLADKRWRALMQ